jgi:hypothetical protein
MSPGAITNFPTKPGLPPTGWTQSEALTGITVNMDNQEFSSPVPDAGALHEDQNIRLDMYFQLGDLTLSSTTAYQDEDQHVVQDLFAINQYIYPAFISFLEGLPPGAGPPPEVINDPNVFPQFENKQDIWA